MRKNDRLSGIEVSGNHRQWNRQILELLRLKYTLYKVR